MSATVRSLRNDGKSTPAPGTDAPIGLGEVLAIVSKCRWRILSAALLPPLLALALVLLLPKTYRAQSDLMVKTGREYMAQGNGESANLTAPTSTKQEEINSEIALLGSRAVAEATINRIGVERLYPAIVSDPPSTGTVMDAALLQFGRDLAIEPVKLSNVVSVSFDAGSLDLARDVLDTLIRLYVDKHTEVFAARRADSFRDSIVTTLAEIRTLDTQRSELRLQTGAFEAEYQRRAAIGSRVSAQNQLDEARIRQGKLTARLAYLQAARARTPATTTLAATELSDTHEHARQAIVDLRAQEAALAARLGDGNPDLMRVRQQIAALSRVAADAGKGRNATTGPSALRQQLEADINATGADLATTGTEIERLQAAIDSRTAELARLERADLALGELDLQIGIMKDNLRAMQGRFEQARADEQTELARQVSVVQVAPASGSQKPVSPRKLIFGAVGLFGGILLAGVVTLLSVLTSKTALTGDAAERWTGLPVLAVLPLGAEGGQGGRARRRTPVGAL